MEQIRGKRDDIAALIACGEVSPAAGSQVDTE
jgi:hypothetical protein